jgi:hypothetical protein
MLISELPNVDSVSDNCGCKCMAVCADNKDACLVCVRSGLRTYALGGFADDYSLRAITPRT